MTELFFTDTLVFGCTRWKSWCGQTSAATWSRSKHSGKDHSQNGSVWIPSSSSHCSGDGRPIFRRIECFDWLWGDRFGHTQSKWQ